MCVPRNLDSEEAQEYFREQDKDEDGMVTFKEYLENYYGFDPDETADWENDENPEMEAYAKVSVQCKCREYIGCVKYSGVWLS